MTLLKYAPAFVLSIFLAGSYLLGFIPLIIPATYLVLGLITYLIYARDKHAAQTGGWRTPEFNLHLYALLSGWPGALIAQQTLRHKTRKQGFRVIFWLTVIANFIGLLWLHSPIGNNVLQTFTDWGQQRVINSTSDNHARKVLLTMLSTYQ